LAPGESWSDFTVRRPVASTRLDTAYTDLIRGDDGRTRIEIGSNAGHLDSTVTSLADGTRVTVGIRPQDCGLSPAAGDGISTTVAYFEHLLEFGLATTTVAGVEEGIVVQTPAQESYEPEQKVVVTAPAERVYLFDAETGERLR